MNPNIVKGLLILLVIIDHNDFARSVIPGFLLGFSFHVLGFLTLPFLRPAPAVDRHLAQYLFRLYYPFFVITTALAIVVFLISPVSPQKQFSLWMLSLYSGNFNLLKESTHMSMLWYLPSFVALVALRALIEQSGRVAKFFILALLIALHPFIGLLPAQIQDYLPLGLLPVLYSIPLCYLAAYLHIRLFERGPRLPSLVASIALLCIVKYLQIRSGLHNELGAAEVADYTQPYALLINDLEAVLGVCMILQIGHLPIRTFFEGAGKYSLQIYCFHAFIAAAFYKILSNYSGKFPTASLFMLSVGLTFVTTLYVSHFLLKSPAFRRIMFPRDMSEIAQAFHVPLIPLGKELPK
ncbi:MAG: acyltransferase family protein [Candidatus Angelobacter sp.]